MLNCSSISEIENYDLAWHIGSIFIILAASLLGVVIPFIFKNQQKYRILFILGKHIGTGILLSLGFIHLLVPAMDYLGNECLGEPWTVYPFSMLFAMLSVLLLHIVEIAVHEYASSHHCTNMVDSMEKYSGHEHTIIHKEGTNLLSVFILEFGLTAHSVIIGLALGVADDSELPALIPALSIHQMFEGIALSSQIINIEVPRLKAFIMALIYILSAPVGVAIGVGIHSLFAQDSVAALLVQGILDSVSAGIILYAAFISLMAYEFPNDLKKMNGIAKKIAMFASVWFGAGVMAAIGIWV
jgi:zinc transporter 1/2/3